MQKALGLAFLVVLSVFTSSCAYRLAGKRLNNGVGMTIAVPTFTNRTTTYRIEQRITNAVREEFIKRTRYTVVPEESGDVVMAGEILSFIAVPVIFNDQGTDK